MEWLKEMRLKRDVTGAKIAEAVGITQQHYSLIETGARRPSVDTAKKIAGVLGFEWTRFFEEEK